MKRIINLIQNDYGTNWEPGVPGGIKFQVNALAVYNDELWIGGGAPLDGVNYCPMDTARKTLARWYLPPTINCNCLQPRIQSHTDTFFGLSVIEQTYALAVHSGLVKTNME